MDSLDVSSSPATEASLRHAYLKVVIASLPQGIGIFDEHLQLCEWNQGFSDLLQLPPENLQAGARFVDLLRCLASHGNLGTGDAETHIQYLADEARQFLPRCFEHTCPDGRSLRIHCEPLRIDGAPAGLVVSGIDISEHKAQEERLRLQQDLLHKLINSLPGGIALFDKDLQLVLHNREALRLLDLPEELTAQSPVSLESILRFDALRGEYGPGDPETLVGKLIARVRKPIVRHHERTLPNGRTLDIHGIPLAGGGFVSICTDITERRSSAEREQLAQKVFIHSPAGVIFTDNAHRVLSVNPATGQITGYEPCELIGHTVFGLINPTPPETPESLQEYIAQRGSWNGELEITSKTGENIPVSVRATRVDDRHASAPSNYIWILADITERRQAEAQMRHIAQHDALTGLPNRLALLMRLGQLLPDARRHQWSMAVMFIDLDHFKIINDTLGHQVGDEMLREVACRLSAAVRETDYVARLGGDEFIVILPAIAMPADAAIIANKIIATLSLPIQAEGHELHTSPSIGISIFPDDGTDGDSILKNADTAMYHAKAAGRNNFQFFAAEMNRITSERLDIERKLRHAIARNELTLHFQPQFTAGSSEPTGVEALLRWLHPSDGMISPDRFIPVAEETGIIVEIGEWVLLNACHQMMHWIRAGLPPLRMAVNVSARQLRRRDFCETVAGVLAESGLPPELLELEITESAVMENPQEAIVILQSLGRMGVTLAIDDFGTGYSSLAYLKLFPIDRLKIDRSFVADIEYDLNDRAIAFGTIALAHSLGLQVIAEGVETDDQHDLLRSNDCDEVQGYLFSKPLNSAAAFAFLHARCTAR